MMARWMLFLGASCLIVALVTAVLLPATCDLSLVPNPPGTPPHCLDTSGSLHDFLASLVIVTLLAGIAALLVGFLGGRLIRRARSAPHP